jgi:hypothetical protein
LTPADRSRVEALWKSFEARLLQAPAHDFETELKLGNLFAYYQLGQYEKVVQYADGYLKTNPDSSTMKLIKERSEAALQDGSKPKTIEMKKKPPRR